MFELGRFYEIELIDLGVFVGRCVKMDKHYVTFCFDDVFLMVNLNTQTFALEPVYGRVKSISEDFTLRKCGLFCD
jgi:hypothetical protein